MARENRALAILLCHMWKVTKKKLQLHTRWVRVGTLVTWEIPLLTSLRIWEHTSGSTSSMVEASSTDERLGGRRLPSKDIVSTKGTTPCEHALRIQWSGVVHFPRIDPTLQEQIRLWRAVTNAIAHGCEVELCKKTKIVFRFTRRHSCVWNVDGRRTL